MRNYVAVILMVLIGSTTAAGAETPRAGMFGGQLVRPTTLAGNVAVELGGGGALYATQNLYWGGGGGTVFQLGEADANMDVELFHGELMLGYDLLQSRAVLVSAVALAGIAMTKQHDGVFGMAEARLAVRKPITKWFMLGGHLGYRRAFASDIDGIDDGDLSGPILGLELYFTR